MGARLLDVAARTGSGVMLVSLYRFLYAPIAYIVFISLSKNIAWLFPLKFSLRGDELPYIGRTYHEALYNSLIPGIGSALLGTFFAPAGPPTAGARRAGQRRRLHHLRGHVSLDALPHYQLRSSRLITTQEAP